MKLPEENPIKEIYPEDVKFTYFDDHDKINNTAGFLIKLYEPITKDEYGVLKVQTLRDSGVRLLQASEIPKILHSLIEENKIEEVEKLDFVEYVYSYKTRIEPTKEIVEKIVLYENNKQQTINPKSEDGIGITTLLTHKLHELNLQATCVFGGQDIIEIKQHDRIAELIFKSPTDITISQWVEPEERYHIPVDERGYRILENVETVLFILEDNLDEGLEAHILVGHRVEGRVGYGCWAINIKEEEKPELDKSWIDGINKLMK